MLSSSLASSREKYEATPLQWKNMLSDGMQLDLRNGLDEVYSGEPGLQGSKK